MKAGIKSSDRMMRLLREISPLPRMIVSGGLDETFDILRENFSELRVHEYPSGMECEDWIVPESWEALEGYLKTEDGRTIAGLAESHLFVAPFSEPVDGWFNKTELLEHTCMREDLPTAYGLEHRVAYNYKFVDWRISVPYERMQALPDDGKYRVRIEVGRRPGAMKVGEYFRRGRSDRIINFCAHIDELCNDDLSGCVVGCELIDKIRSLEAPRFSYQVLLVPEMFGALYYVGENTDTVRSTACMVNLEALGVGDELILKKALAENTVFERTLRKRLQDMGLEFREMGFFEAYGNDERVYGWPTLNVPGISLQRYPFPQYHSSLDTPDIIRPELLAEAVEILEGFIDMMEKNQKPRFTGILPPWLTKHDLYHDCQLEVEKFQKMNNLVLFNVNGENSLLDLAELSGLEFNEVEQYIDAFVGKGFIQFTDE